METTGITLHTVQYIPNQPRGAVVQPRNGELYVAVCEFSMHCDCLFLVNTN